MDAHFSHGTSSFLASSPASVAASAILPPPAIGRVVIVAGLMLLGVPALVGGIVAVPVHHALAEQQAANPSPLTSMSAWQAMLAQPPLEGTPSPHRADHATSADYALLDADR